MNSTITLSLYATATKQSPKQLKLTLTSVVKSLGCAILNSGVVYCAILDFSGEEIDFVYVG